MRGDCLIISGFQKLTLLDFPGKTACTVFTPGCNFRCPFCHNTSLVLQPCESERIPEGEILAYLDKRKGILDGVVITGGEPLLHSDIPDFLRKVKNLGYKIKLDTNGSMPELLLRITEDGLVDYVAMDIKNSPDQYAKTVGISDLDLSPVRRSVEILMNGDTEYEFRTTLVSGLHTQGSVKDLAKWISGAKRYYLQRFKDSGNLISPDGLSSFNEVEMKEFADLVKPYVSTVQLRGI